MKANTTPKRIINLFQHPSKRFTNAVSTIADSRIALDHAEHASLVFGGNSETPDAALLIEANLRKVFNITESFTVEAGENDLFVEQFEETTTFPAGTNVLVVNIAAEGEEPAYRFDLLASPMPSEGGSEIIKVKIVDLDVTPGQISMISLPRGDSYSDYKIVGWRASGYSEKQGLGGTVRAELFDCSNLCVLGWIDSSPILEVCAGATSMMDSDGAVDIHVTSIEFYFAPDILIEQ
jgi:hypothetical protein